ncbi:hypothetical protein OESDEN_04069 [Oesophagostomum dentatum]|uniref:Uncharacterized protein n=1 Tax=Oesophagostomum dentatum TaxID=61180 RepID=A0A0B1TJG5_OESDE|nr:hypothetical protein OESDEN_04069 [Oesophagostomum dentatum]
MVFKVGIHANCFRELDDGFFYQLMSCLKRNVAKGGAAPSGCCMRKDIHNRGSKNFDSWRNTVSDISTCEIINPPSVDCGLGDAGLEAKIRHRTLTWYPELKLQPRSIIRKNYRLQNGSLQKYDLSQLPKHPPHANVENALTPEEILERKAKYKEKHITWEQDCPVFVVYGYDQCRGELEYDENTMDDLSFKEAEEIEKNVDKILLPHTPNREVSKSKSD